jgi:hypothetical protein
LARPRKTTEEWIKQAKAVHGDRYDYSETVYNGWLQQLDIICPVHGKFSQRADNHVHGFNCWKCTNKARSNTQEFIEKAKQIHGDKYDYSLVVYRSDVKKVKIICPIHGVFEQAPRETLDGCECPMCAMEKRNMDIKSSKTHKINEEGVIVSDYGEAWKQAEHYCFITPEELNKPKEKPKTDNRKGIDRLLIDRRIRYITNHEVRDKKIWTTFDYYLPDKNIYIVYRKEEDYEKRNYFDYKITINKYEKNDKLKEKWCKENGYHFLTVKYSDNIEQVIVSFCNKLDSSVH